MAQKQFLNVIDRDEAYRRFWEALRPAPLGSEMVPLEHAHGRVLAQTVCSAVDVPSFDRSNVDGYAVRSTDVVGASEEAPVELTLSEEEIPTGKVPTIEVQAGNAITIATGGMVPRGADAIVMVEHTDVSSDGKRLLVRRSVASGANIAFAGTDICSGEVVLRPGDLLTSRETGVLAAIGTSQIAVVRQPRVAILSTGDEIIAPGEVMTPSHVYDSNSRILADTVRELGGVPVVLGIVRDNLDQLRTSVQNALQACDLVLLSGGTSKGGGDLSYCVVQEFSDPGIVAHGVALKPGKPICLAVTQGKAVVVLPGFPTSAIFTFHEFIADVIRELAGHKQQERARVQATLPVKVNSELGRTEYLLVGLVSQASVDAVDSTSANAPQLAAYPMGKGSGSVTTFSRADGFVTIDRHTEIIEAGSVVSVQLLSDPLQLADLVVIGSQCAGLDWLLGELQAQGMRTKFLAVGSMAGLEAAKRGECDIAGIHLLDPVSQTYNAPFVKEPLRLTHGYQRLQGIAYRPGDARFEGETVASAMVKALADPRCLMINRNAGSGTRILMDRLLAGAKPPGYAIQPKSHHAVAAAIAQQRGDWGVCIEAVALAAGLHFLPLADESYDFVSPASRFTRPAVKKFYELLSSPRAVTSLRSLRLSR